MPYAAENIADFWRRWHISLSNWLRDYLYFSLPGLRSKWKIFTYMNLFITMVLGGLWHGASWNFVIWGLLHGLGLAVSARGRGNRGPSGSRLAQVARIFVTVNFVCFTWIFFRSPTLDAAMGILNRIGSLTISFDNISKPVAIVLAIAVVAHYFPLKWHGVGGRPLCGHSVLCAGRGVDAARGCATVCFGDRSGAVHLHEVLKPCDFCRQNLRWRF